MCQVQVAFSSITLAVAGLCNIAPSVSVQHCTPSVCLTSLVVILSLTRGTANVMKVVIPSTVWGTDSQTDMHCSVIAFPLFCIFKQVVNCWVLATYQLAVPPDRDQTATWQWFSSSCVVVSPVYSQITRPSWVMVSCTVGCSPVVTGSSSHSRATLEEQVGGIVAQGG